MSLNDYHVVILSSIKWDFLWQRHQIIAEYFANYTDVTYIETTGLRNPNFIKSMERFVRGMTYKQKKQKMTTLKAVKIHPPIVAPPTNPFYRSLNRTFFVPNLVEKIQSYSKKPILFITYLPTTTTLYLIEKLKPTVSIYDCVLNFENFPGVPKDIHKTESALIKSVNLLIVDSTYLLGKHKYKKNAIKQIPSAVDFDLFHKAYSGIEPKGKQLIATYFGGIDPYRIEWELIEHVLQVGITVQLIGPAPDGIPISHPNLIYRKPIPHQELPEALKDSDVLLLPYKVTEFMKGTFPAKLYECFATGKPIVTTPLPELLHFNDLVEIAEEPMLFAEKVQSAILNDTQEKRERRITLAKNNSWTNRCETYKEEIEKAILESVIDVGRFRR